MQVQFTNGGIRYNIQLRTRSLTDPEPEILPDRTLWSSAQKKRAMTSTSKHWKNRYGQGQKDLRED